MSSGKWRPFCLGRNVLKLIHVSSMPMAYFKKGLWAYNQKVYVVYTSRHVSCRKMHKFVVKFDHQNYNWSQ